MKRAQADCLKLPEKGPTRYTHKKKLPGTSVKTAEMPKSAQGECRRCFWASGVRVPKQSDGLGRNSVWPVSPGAKQGLQGTRDSFGTLGPDLVNLSLLLSEDFCVFLSFLSDRSVFAPSDKHAENMAIAGKFKKKPEILTN